MADPRRDMPFGWSQGDPLVVCLNRLHMDYVIRAFNLRAHYILPLERPNGRRYNKMIVFSPHTIRGSYEQRQYERWLEETKLCCLDIGGEFYLV